MDQKIKILIVDDEEQVCAALKRALEQTGRYAVHSALGGAEALDMLGTIRPRFIFIDLMMPRMTGPELAKALREDARTRDIPYAYLTGLLDKPSVAALGGFLDGERYAAKPASVSELIAIIESALVP